MSEDSSANVIKALKINDLQTRIADLEAQNALLENQLQKLSHFTDPHAKGAIGRFLTADEIIREWASRAVRFDEQVESLERQNALLRPVAAAARDMAAPVSAIRLLQLKRVVRDGVKAAIDGGAMGGSE